MKLGNLPAAHIAAMVCLVSLPWLTFPALQLPHMLAWSAQRLPIAQDSQPEQSDAAAAESEPSAQAAPSGQADVPATPADGPADQATQPSTAPAGAGETDQQLAARYIQAIRTYADTVLEHGRDTYNKPTPLFVDGLEVATYEPVRWTYDDHVWTLSNLANHQDLLRTLDGLTNLTGEARYRQAAVDAIRYALDHLRVPNGLLLWGGHVCYDAQNDEWVGRRYARTDRNRSPVHELKACYPYYELMWQVDAPATRQFMRAFWAAHVRDWSRLDFDRHGEMNKPLRTGADMWDRPFDEKAEVNFRGKGRTFVNTGSDLYYAAGMLYKLDGDAAALTWAQRIAGRYSATRDPNTGLRGYQFSTPDELDRAFEQFGDLFPNSLVREATIFRAHEMPAPLLTLLQLSEKLGEAGAPLRQIALEDLRAIGRVSFDETRGVFRTMLTDGTDISDVPMPRDGYFGKKGKTFGAAGGGSFFLVYATAARLGGDPFMWEMARRTGKSARVGDIGASDGSGISMTGTGGHSPETIVALLELHRMTGRRAYVDQACRVAQNILAHRFENGLFTSGANVRYARISDAQPLAILTLAATLAGKPDQVSQLMDGDEFFACELKSTDKNYTFDRRVIYNQPRK